jgi:hypothetical protein
MICYLCGKELDKKTRTKDHIPPAQFLPKILRSWYEKMGVSVENITRKSCGTCNKKFERDEKYFFYKWVFAIRTRNDIGALLWDFIKLDISNNSSNEQLWDEISKEIKPYRKLKALCSSGDNLIEPCPPGKGFITISERDKRVLWKIFRGLYFIEKKKFLPDQTGVIFHFCEPGTNPPDEIYSVLLKQSGKGKHKRFFDYKILDYPEQKRFQIAILLWDILKFSASFHYT